ncbi:MAG TPA: bacillithiol biosynthesis cysteine-adding enzyme BshC [Terriglobales bacterium]|nr:bacillithiol biosynthesis cysteine-adding enzyme BshC [Terriglobales bacterium]
MRSECLPFRLIPHSTPLFLDYLDYGAKIQQFYPRPPHLLEWVQEEARRIEYGADRRERVANVLERQNRHWNGSSETLKNIERLRAGAAAIVTGQQVALFGGPLFSILKALTAVRLAEEATAGGIDCVPLFWLATEDHDLEEVNHTWIPGAGGVLQRIRSDSRGVEDAPVGSIRFGAEIEQAVGQAADLLGESEMTDLLRESYRPGETLGSAFARLFAGIFHKWGVIQVDASDPELRRIAQPIYLAAIENAEELDRKILERGKELEEAGYHQQVKVTPSSTLLFEIRDGRRTAIRRVNGGMFLAGEEKVTREQLLDKIENMPEGFSPNVLLRPVEEDYLLPTLAYTGGPAEVAYFAQAGVVFEKLLGRVTPVLPRFSATLVEAKQQKLLDKYRIKLSDLFHGPEETRRRLAERALASGLQEKFERVAKQMQNELYQLLGELERLDPTLVDAGKHAESKIQHQLEQLRARAARAELRKDEDITRHADTLSAALFPDKGLQEREVAGVYFLARHGLSLVEQLYEATQTRCPDHQVMYL